MDARAFESAASDATRRATPLRAAGPEVDPAQVKEQAVPAHVQQSAGPVLSASPLLQSHVYISGIMGRKELNGQCGIAISYCESKGRYVVCLDESSEEILVKTANLRPWIAVGSRAAVPSPKGTDCPVCLQLLANPVTLGCGHNFCQHCLYAALIKGYERCPVCRAAVPPTQLLEPNHLLVSLLCERNPDAYESRLAELPSYMPAESSLVKEIQGWKLHVDFLSPASLILLAVDHAFGAPLSGSLSEQHARFSDDLLLPEWDLADEADCVPRLEVTGDAAPGTSA